MYHNTALVNADNMLAYNLYRKSISTTFLDDPPCKIVYYFLSILLFQESISNGDVIQGQLKAILLSDSFHGERKYRKEEYDMAYDRVETLLTVLNERLNGKAALEAKYAEFEKNVGRTMNDMKTFGNSLSVWMPAEIQV